MDYVLATYASGKYTKGLVVFSAAVCSRLFCPLRTLYLDILACICHMTEVGDLYIGCYAQ